MTVDSTKNEINIQKTIQDILTPYSGINTIIAVLHQHGARVFLAGGAVRDLMLKLPVKDIDIEVHNIALDQLQSILGSYGPVKMVGKIYGVLRVGGLNVDWSIPRKDTAGRKPQVVLDPFLSIKHACERRDLTMNAMLIDLVTFELLDPFGGLEDMRRKVLRTPNPTLFVEDPLRFYRVMQFISRFEMMPDTKLDQVCRTMNIAGVSSERIEEECKKMLLRSRRPSLGLRWLEQIKRLHELMPELAATRGVIQDVRWHPEGDVFEHSMQAVDAAARITQEHEAQQLMLNYAALLHDIGKTTTTECVDGKIRSYGHAQEGARMAKRLLKRITHNQDLIQGIVKLVDTHMQPVPMVTEGAKPAAYKRLAKKLMPECSIALLADLAIADSQGRNAESHEPLTMMLPEITEFLARADLAHVTHRPEEPVLWGRDLVDVMKPGPAMGAALKKAYAIQIEEGITDKAELKKRVMA